MSSTGTLWLVYLSTVLVCFLGWWLLLRKIWNTSAVVVSFLVLAAPFLVPFGVSSEYSTETTMAPALIVAAFEVIAGNQAMVVDALTAVLLVECVVLSAVLIYLFLRKKRA